MKYKPFRPTLAMVEAIYDGLNVKLFDGKLSRPEIVIRRMRLTHGWCIGYDNLQLSGSCCVIELAPFWQSPEFLTDILAHEMVHQFQWDFHGDMEHDDLFYGHTEKFAKFGITLKERY